MDNHIDTTTTDNLTVADAAKIIVVETGRAVAITAVQYVGAFAVLTIGGVAVNQAQKFKARRAAKKATTIETIIPND